MITIAQLLAQSLYNVGVRTIFGLPGGEVVELLDAFRQVGITFVLVKNESSAIYMADVTARLTQTIGVAITTLGPGAANAYAGMAHAYLDRAPVLLITAQTDPQRVGTHTHQLLDLQASFRPVTKFTAELKTATAAATIQFALTQLSNGRFGPVHLGLCDRVARSHTRPIPPSPPALPQVNISSHITPIQKALNRSRQPIIIVGLGLEPEAPYTELRAFAEAIQAPVIDTPKAKGAVPATHPLFVGTIGLTTKDPAYDLLNQADCIIAIGFDVVELVKPWSQTVPLIWLAPWPNHDPHLPAIHEYVGPLKPLLTSLATTTHNNNLQWGISAVVNFHTQLAQRPLPQAANGRITPQDTLHIIREHTPDDVIITTDVGSHKIFTALTWPALRSNRYFLSNGLSAMGFGLAAAIAAAHVTQKPTICITGDGGLAMVLGELALAVEMNLPLIVVMMNDNALDLIRSAQQRKNKPVFGTTFTNPDYSLIAQSYGLNYHHVNDVPSCEAAIKAALAAQQPCLIDVQIDPLGYPTTVKK